MSLADTIKANPTIAIGGVAIAGLVLFMASRGGGGGAAPQPSIQQETSGPSVVTTDALNQALAQLRTDLEAERQPGGAPPPSGGGGSGNGGGGGDPSPLPPSGQWCPPGMQRDPVSGNCVPGRPGPGPGGGGDPNGNGNGG